jgi:hypothetical protein
VLDDVKGWFAKVFKNAPSAEVTALSALNTVAPEAEILLDLIDPAAGAIATPIITEVQADLGTVANLLKSGNTVNLGTFLAAIKSNLSLLLTEGHITDPASVTKATGIVGAISGVITSLQNQYATA